MQHDFVGAGRRRLITVYNTENRTPSGTKQTSDNQPQSTRKLSDQRITSVI